MFTKSTRHVYGALLMSSAFILAACGGGGSGGGSGGGPRITQNAVYVHSTGNVVAAARDDASLAPFGLVSIYATPFALSVSPNSRHVVFKVTNPTNGAIDLFVTHSNGAYATRLTSLPAGRNVTDFSWSPDGNRLVYLADQITAGKSELFMTTAPFDSGADTSASTVRISAAIDSSATLDIANPKWSPDGSKVAYVITDSAITTSFTKVVGINYHDVAIGNRHSVRITPPFTASQELPSREYFWSADGTRLAYVSNPVGNIPAAFQIHFTGASFSHSQLPLDSAYSVQQVRYSADSLLLAATQSNGTTHRVTIQNASTGTTINQYDTLDAIDSIDWANQVRVLAIRVRNQATRRYSLKISDVDRSAYNVILHDGDVTGEHANNFYWSHDGDHLAVLTSGTAERLQSYNITSRAATVLVTLPSNTYFIAARWSQDDQRIAYGTYVGTCQTDGPAKINSTSSSSSSPIELDSMRCGRGFVY